VRRGTGEDILTSGMIALFDNYSSPAKRFTGTEYSRLRRRKRKVSEVLLGVYLHHCLHSFCRITGIAL
jgi:hypothetical protein